MRVPNQRMAEILTDELARRLYRGRLGHDQSPRLCRRRGRPLRRQMADDLGLHRRAAERLPARPRPKSARASAAGRCCWPAWSARTAAGSRRPTCPVPAGAAELAARDPAGSSRADRDRARASARRGAAGADVMRGEEVQVLGAVAAGLVPPDALICHPGTHAKWIRVEGGRIARLPHDDDRRAVRLLKAPLASSPTSCRAAVRAGLGRLRRGRADRPVRRADLLSSLFGIRARHVLGEGERRRRRLCAAGC